MQGKWVKIRELSSEWIRICKLNFRKYSYYLNVTECNISKVHVYMLWIVVQPNPKLPSYWGASVPKQLLLQPTGGSLVERDILPLPPGKGTVPTVGLLESVLAILAAKTWEPPPVPLHPPRFHPPHSPKDLTAAGIKAYHCMALRWVLLGLIQH